MSNLRPSKPDEVPGGYIHPWIAVAALLALAAALLCADRAVAGEAHPGEAAAIEAGEPAPGPGYWVDLSWFEYDARLALDLAEARIQIADLTFQWESEIKIAEPAARHISKLERRVRQLESVARSPALNLVIGWAVGVATVILGGVVYIMAGK